MGSLRELIRQAEGAGPEGQRGKALLELAFAAARAHLDTARRGLDVELTWPAASPIPALRVIRDVEAYHVAVQGSLGDLVSAHLDHALDAFFSFAEQPQKEAVQHGVKTLVQVDLQSFVDRDEPGESIAGTSFVVPERDDLLRADVRCWKYHLEEDLFAGHDTVVAYLLRTSEIDRSRTDLVGLVGFASQPVHMPAYVDEVVRLWKKLEAEP